MTRSLRVLLIRELRGIAVYTLGLMAATFGVMAIPLIQLPLRTALLRTLYTPQIFALLAVLQMVQMAIWKEKVGGGFLFARMLPLSDSEVLSSKLLAIISSALIIFLIPLMVLGGAMLHLGLAFPRSFWLACIWFCLLLAATAVGMAASTIRFNSQKALALPFFVIGALFALGYGIQKMFPRILSLGFRIGFFKWGLVIAFLLIWLGWMGTIKLFSRRDFVQLSE